MGFSNKPCRSLIAAREHPKVVAPRLGLASIRTTLDVYGHLLERLDQAAADRLNAMRSESSVANRCRGGHSG